MLAFRISLLVLFGAFAFPQGTLEEAPPTSHGLGPRFEVVLTGRITDRETGSPLQSAQLSIAEQNIGAVTDQNGIYTLNLPDGWVGRRIRVVVQHVGYATVEERVRLSEGSNTLDVRMRAVALALDALVVSASRGEAERLMAPAAMAATIVARAARGP